MGQYRYITKRVLQSRAGEDRGSIMVAVKADSDAADVKYVCPECQDARQISETWKRPFSVKCVKCGFRMSLPKLKGKK